MNNLCSICMRAGSKEVRKKSLKYINNRPLMAYTIEQALKCKLFTKIVVSTDSKKISKQAKLLGVDYCIDRPKKLATDISAKLPAIRHALIQAEKFFDKKFNIIVDLDITSPLRNIRDIVNAYRLFIKKKADFLITGTKSKKNPYFNIVEINNNKIKIVKNSKKKIVRRQDAPKTYDLNASIYIWKRKTLIKEKSLNQCKAVIYEMPEHRSIDIDSEFDLRIVKFLLKKNK